MSLNIPISEVGTLCLIYQEEIFTNSEHPHTQIGAELVLNNNSHVPGPTLQDLPPSVGAGSLLIPQKPIEAFPKIHPIPKPEKFTPTTPSQPTPNPEEAGYLAKKNVKILYMVGYQGLMPQAVVQAIKKVHHALGYGFDLMALINALDPNAPLESDFEYTYLVLLGGKGKNIGWLQTYTGSRQYLEIAQHKNKYILFAEPMEVYLANKDSGRKFWETLKQMCAKA